jgi:CMP-N,N'-diacetyllegionaminic acid synthase
MINNQKVLAIIPARESSKRLKNKNIRIFDKKPLIHWTIVESLKSKYIDKVIVSSDSKKILRISSKYKKIEFSLRPKFLSSDKSNISRTLLYELKKNNVFDIIILLQPTSPLRSAKVIDSALNLMIKKKKSSCVSFLKLKYFSNFIFSIINDKISFYYKNNFIKNKKQTSLYYPSGDFYISTKKRFLIKKDFIDKNTYPYIIREMNYNDIDTFKEFKIAEFLKKKLYYFNKN